MKIKKYDSSKKAWKTLSSSNASSIKVEDIKGNFKDPSIYKTDEKGNKVLVTSKTKNVESCFGEVSDKISKLGERVEYIYEHGTIG